MYWYCGPFQSTKICDLSQHKGWTFQLCFMSVQMHFVHKRKIQPNNSILILVKSQILVVWLKRSFSAKFCQHKLVTFNYVLTKFGENPYKFLGIIKEINQEFYHPHSIILCMKIWMWYIIGQPDTLLTSVLYNVVHGTDYNYATKTSIGKHYCLIAVLVV